MPLAALAIALTAPQTLLAAELPAGPLTPQQESATFQLADENLAIELVASEPNVSSPVAIAWDADGRLFVAEMIDYPSGPAGGQIRMLEDKDGDGKYEKATVFADKLPFPNGVLPWNGGLLVTAAPNIWFLKDTDGDGRADERRIVLTGFGEGNQQLRANGLTWGLDNWVYGANGRSDGTIRRPNDAPAKAVSIRRRDFRFRPDTGEFEAIAGPSQFGSPRDDWGNRFLSWNTIPIRHEVLEERYLNRNPNLPVSDSLQNLLPPGDPGQVFPLTPAPLVFNNESSSHFNALAGLAIYRGDALGEKYRGNAFAGESLRNLTHRRVLEPNGVTFAAKRGEESREFLASTDPWFHSVNFATGPDGALYLVDFYRRFVEHPDYIPGSLRAQVPWQTGADHGRIWRIKRKDSPLRPQDSKPRLSDARSAELVKYLSHPNGWWRDTAQRLLVERQDRSTIPFLKSQIANRKSQIPLSRLHALWTLEGLGALDEKTILLALQDKQSGIREHAVRLAESLPLPEMTKLQGALVRLGNDSDPRVRFRLALAAGKLPEAKRIKMLTGLAGEGIQDRWQRLAILCSIGDKAWPFFAQLVVQYPKWIAAPTVEQGSFLEIVSELVGVQSRQTDAELAGFLGKLQRAHLAPGRVMVLAGLADGMSRGNAFPRGTNGPASGAAREIMKALAQYAGHAAGTATSEAEPSPFRLAAVRILAHLPPNLSAKPLLGLLLPGHSAEIQAAATRAVMELEDRSTTAALFTNWRQYSITIRRQVINGALRSSALIPVVVEAMEKGGIQGTELDASARQKLQQVASGLLKWIASKENSPAANRDEVVRSFQASLKLEGSRPRGAALFAKTCLACHSVQGQGGRVGPDLSGIGTRPKEAMLVDILDPSRQITPDFINYSVETIKGEKLNGLIAAETAASIALRRVGEADLSISRRDIAHLQAEKISLMPEGFEQGLAHQDMADLLEFLQQPDKSLLPAEK